MSLEHDHSIVPASDQKVRTADALARKHTEAAIATLAELMECADKDNVRVAAAKEILDRGYGKPLVATITLPASRKLASQLYAMDEEELLAVVRGDEQPSFARGAEEASLAAPDDFDVEAELASLPSLHDGDPLLE